MLLVSLIPKHMLKPWPCDALAGGWILEGGLGVAPLRERRRLPPQVTGQVHPLS